MSKHHDIKKFIEMQLFFQSHSKLEIDEKFESQHFNNESNVQDVEYMLLIEDLLTGEDVESHSIFGKYKN